MTNESDFFTQAEPEKASGSTYERKKMSTKTLRKRIALVAVAALGFGVVNGVSANAAETSLTTFSIMSSSASSVDAVAPLTSTITYASADLSITAGAGTPFATSDVGRGIWSDEFGFIGTIASVTSTTKVILTAAPTASGSGTLTAMADTDTSDNWWIGTKATTTVGDGITTSTIKGMTVTAGKAAALNLKFDAATNDDVSKFRISVGGTVLQLSPLTAIGDQNKVLAFTAPVTAGTYEAVVSYAVAADFTAASTVSKPFTLTVVADSAFSSGTSTVYLNDDPTATDGATTAAVDALGATGIKTSGTAGAVIWVNLKKADGSVYAGGTLYAQMTGAGFLDIDAATSLRADSVTNDGNHYIKVMGDGTSGVGTVNIYIILADGVTRVDLPSKNVSFYGDVAKLEAKVEQGIATVGTENGNCTALTDCTYATLAETPAVLVKATDANGVLVPGLTVVGVPADTNVVGSSAVSAATGGTDKHGAGYYNASLTGGPATQAGKSSTVTYKVTLSDGTVISSNAVNVSLASTPASVSMSFDKATYAPGEKGTITVTAKDASGNLAGDNTYANLFAGASTVSKSVQGSTPAASVELVGGKATYTFYAPVQGGSFTITNTADTSVAAAGRVAVSASANVEDSASSAVTAQIASLISKINALSKLIAKIQKKLGVK